MFRALKSAITSPGSAATTWSIASYTLGSVVDTSSPTRVPSTMKSAGFRAAASSTNFLVRQLECPWVRRSPE